VRKDWLKVGQKEILMADEKVDQTDFVKAEQMV
jgi:hypothetical protein